MDCKGPVMRDNKTGKIIRDENGNPKYEWYEKYKEWGGLTDDGLSCWLGLKWRKGPKLPKCVKEGQENHLGVCYDKCQDKAVGGGHVTSYKGVGPTCWQEKCCLLYTSPSPRDQRGSRMPSSA